MAQTPPPPTHEAMSMPPLNRMQHLAVHRPPPSSSRHRVSLSNDTARASAATHGCQTGCARAAPREPSGGSRPEEGERDPDRLDVLLLHTGSRAARPGAVLRGCLPCVYPQEGRFIHFARFNVRRRHTHTHSPVGSGSPCSARSSGKIATSLAESDLQRRTVPFPR